MAEENYFKMVNFRILTIFTVLLHNTPGEGGSENFRGYSNYKPFPPQNVTK